MLGHAGTDIDPRLPQIGAAQQGDIVTRRRIDRVVEDEAHGIAIAGGCTGTRNLCDCRPSIHDEPGTTTIDCGNRMVPITRQVSDIAMTRQLRRIPAQSSIIGHK